MIGIEGGVLTVHLLGHDHALADQGLDPRGDQIIVTCPRRPRQVARTGVLVASHCLSPIPHEPRPAGPRLNATSRTLPARSGRYAAPAGGLWGGENYTSCSLGARFGGTLAARFSGATRSGARPIQQLSDPLEQRGRPKGLLDQLDAPERGDLGLIELAVREPA